MQSGIRTHYYLGAESRFGYFTLYGSLLSSVMCETQYILKGGHAYGKTLFLEKLTEHINAAGYNTECYHSAANPDNLEGILIPECKTVFVDGELPHAVNAQYPGAVETYIDIGARYDYDGLKGKKDAIVRLTQEVEKLRKKLTRYLSAAGEVRDNIREPVKTDKIVNKIKGRAIRNAARELGRAAGAGGVSYRFLNSAVTTAPDFSSVFACCKKISVLDNDFGLAHEMLSYIHARAAAAGYDTVICLDPLEPEKSEHLIIPALSLAYISKTGQLELDCDVYKHFRLDALPKENLTQDDKMRIKSDKKLYNSLVTKAGETRIEISRLNEKLSDIYIPSLKTTALTGLAEEYAGKIIRS